MNALCCLIVTKGNFQYVQYVLWKACCGVQDCWFNFHQSFNVKEIAESSQRGI